MPMSVSRSRSERMMDMPGFRGVTIDVADGPRWELALSLIDSGEAAVKLGDVEISRHASGPTADGMIRMMIKVDRRANRDMGLAALQRGRQIAEQAARSDPRFADMLNAYGCRWEVVHDYGMGTVLLGEAERCGDLVWLT